MSISNSDNKFEKYIAYLLLFLIAAFNAWGFLPELQGEALHHSDLGFHLSVFRALDAAVKSGRNPFDFWLDETPFGFALFRSYQNLPYVITYSVYRLLGEHFTLDFCMRSSLLVLAMLLPITIFWAARILRFGILESAFAGILASLISEIDGFGFGLQNYTFGTAGIFTQLWAVVALGPAIGLTVRYLKTGSGLGLSLLFTFFCFGSHVVSAFVIFFTISLFALIELHATKKAIIKRFFFYFAGVLLVTSYQWVFVFQDGLYINQSVIEQPWKYASHGINWTMKNFWTGEFFDSHRFPCITILLLFGFFPAFARQKTSAATNTELPGPPLVWLALSFVLSLSLLAGWEIWGLLFKDTPVLRSLHMHRFIIAVNLFGVFLAAHGIKVLRELFPARRSYQTLAIGLLLLLLHPALTERYNRYRLGHEWRAIALEALEKNQDLQDVFAYIKTQPRTFIHPGMRANWEAQLKLAGMVQLHCLTIAQGFPTLGGMLYHAFSLAGDTMFSFSPWRRGTYDLFGIGYVISPASIQLIDSVKKVATFGDYAVWSSGATRLDVIDVLYDINGPRQNEPRAMQQWVNSPLVERKIHGAIHTTLPEAYLHLSFVDPVPDKLFTTSSPGKLITEGTWSAAGITGSVKIDRHAYVLFKTGYHPNWKAWVDGVKAKTTWVTPGFVAVAIQPGEHQIKFEYHGSYLKVFLFIFSLIVFAFTFRYERRIRT